MVLGSLVIIAAVLIYRSFLNTRSITVEPGELRFVRPDKLHLRQGPSTKEEIITELVHSEPVEIRDSDGRWMHVLTEKGQSGWVHSDYLVRTTREYRQFLTSLEKAGVALDDNPSYLDIKDKGHGVIEVKASNPWLLKPEQERVGDVEALLDLWEAARGKGKPVALIMTSTAGRVKMDQRRNWLE